MLLASINTERTRDRIRFLVRVNERHMYVHVSSSRQRLGLGLGCRDQDSRDHYFVDIYHKASYHRMICNMYTTIRLGINVECSIVDTCVGIGHCTRSLQCHVLQLGDGHTKHSEGSSVVSQSTTRKIETLSVQARFSNHRANAIQHIIKPLTLAIKMLS